MRSAAQVSAIALLTAVFLWLPGLPPSIAQSQKSENVAPNAATPGVITQGSGNVSAGGQAAARKGDTDDKGNPLIEGSPNVFINGRPAATLGDRTGCGGVTVGGSSNVFVNGKPLARAGDMTSGCEQK